MNFNYKIAASSFAFALPLISNAASMGLPDNILFYGKAEIQLNFTDQDKTAEHDGLRYVKKGTQFDSPYSRIGFKGAQKLNDNLTAIFKFEYQVKGFDNDSTETLSARNTYIGLKSLYGELVIGRNDTRFKASEGKFDLFNETAADIGQIMPGQDRIGDTATYTSPKLSGIQFALTAAPKDDIGTENGYAWLVTIGDKAMKKSVYYAAYAGTQALNGLDMHRVIVNYRINALTLGALFQQSETSDNSKSGNGYMLNASYQVDNIVAKIQFAHDDSEIRHNETSDQITLGVDYIFDKQTKVYAMYSQLELETSDDNNLGLGLQYKF